MKDLFNQDIQQGDYVAAWPSNNGVPEIYEVVGFNPKTLKVRDINDSQIKSKSPEYVLLIPKEDVKNYIPAFVCDHFGKPLSVGDCVISSDAEYIDLRVMTVSVIFTTKVEVKYSKVYGRAGRDIRYGHDLIKVPEEMVTYSILKGV